MAPVAAEQYSLQLQQQQQQQQRINTAEAGDEVGRVACLE